MPEYSYSCDPQDGGCGYFFTVSQNRSEYKQLKRCPECKKHRLIRDYETDTVHTSVKLSDSSVTLGHLADRNSSKMSADQKAVLKQKHNKHREENKDALPVKGTRIKRTKESPSYRSSNFKEIKKMTETQQKNYIRSGKKNG
tara:strand:+ start:2395 stop:2820 length:426 start_codon:yes stop_codon:yes gene_type:complete